MKIPRLKMHKWRRNIKLVVVAGVIVAMIIVVAQARPPIFDDKHQRLDENVIAVPAAVAHMDQERVEPQPIPDKPEEIPIDNNQPDNLLGDGFGAPKKSEQLKFESELNRDTHKLHDNLNRVDNDADAANAGPDRGDDSKLREEDDDGDAEAVADGAGKVAANDRPKGAAVGDEGLRFVNEGVDIVTKPPRPTLRLRHDKRLDVHEKLRVKDLQPDHLDAVKLEKDGHLNRDYKKEIFVGNHEEIEEGSDEERKQKLEDVFHKVDVDKDSFIILGELEEWIILKVQEHFDEAHQENEHIFKTLDQDKSGYIDWKEFHVQYLMAKGHDQKRAEKHAEDYETIPVEAEDKEQLIRYKFRWAEADEDPQDNQLNLDEFKSFRHPEQSRKMLTKMVQDILDNLDHNSDGFVSEKEFASLPPGDVDPGWAEADRAWQDERRKEFRNVIDLDRNGRVTRDELKTYVDPGNPNHASLEAKNLITLADLNNDGKLSLSEIMENMELFLGSKMVDTGRNFHDEF